MRSPISFGIFTEKKEGRGEDAAPFIHLGDPGDPGLLAVFDGMGGAGGKNYRTDNGVRSGAYIAAHLARETVWRWFQDEGAGLAPGDRADALRAALESALEKKLVEVQGDGPKGRIVSKMLRQLPTTAAIILIEGALPEVSCQVLWAGDSRAYLLAPDCGLAQLTTDHLRDKVDAQESLRNDPPMANCISASGSFYIDTGEITLADPAILLVATDGCFNYVASPAMFEDILLTTLVEALDLDDWRTRIMRRIREITADDATMALVALGWNSMSDVREAFKNRHTYLSGLVTPIRQAERRAVEERRSFEIRRAAEARDQDARRLSAAQAALERRRSEMNVDEASVDLAQIRSTLSALRLEVAQLRLQNAEPLPSALEQDAQRLRETETAKLQDDIDRLLPKEAEAEERVKEAKARLTATDELEPDAGRAEANTREDLDIAEDQVRRAADEVWAEYRNHYERHLKESAAHRQEEGDV